MSNINVGFLVTVLAENMLMKMLTIMRAKQILKCIDTKYTIQHTNMKAPKMDDTATNNVGSGRRID